MYGLPFTGLHDAPFLHTHFWLQWTPKELLLHGRSHCCPSHPAGHWHCPVSEEHEALFLPKMYPE